MVEPVSLAIGIGVSLSALAAWVARDIFRDKTPITAIANVKPGEKARIVGKVIAADPMLEAPVSGRPCAAFEVNVYSLGYRNTHHSYRRCEHGEITIEDHSGRAIVRAEDIRLVLRSDRGTSGGLTDFTDRLRAWISKHDVRTDGWRGTRFDEGAVEIDELVEVIGVASIVDGQAVFDQGTVYVGDASPLDALAAFARDELRNVPVVKTPSLEGVRVNLVGTVETDAPLIAPVSERPCAAYEVTIAYDVDGSQKCFLQERRVTPFVLVCDDGTRVHVEPPSVVATALKNDGVTEGYKGLPAKLMARLNEHSGGKPSGMHAHIEGVLEVGRRAGVVGTLTRDTDDASPTFYRDRPTRWVLRAGDAPLVIGNAD